jgi:hypothetical protein
MCKISINKLGILILCLFSVSNIIFAQVPEICRLQGGHTKTVWGAGFKAGETELYSEKIPYDEAAVIEALRSNQLYNPAKFSAVSPTENAAKLNILTVDEKGLVLAAEFSDDYKADGFYDFRIGDDVLWAKNKAGYSKPYLIKSPQLWFGYPELLSGGDIIRVFGRSVNAKLIAIRKSGEKDLLVLKDSKNKNRSLALVHNVSYEAGVRLPEELTPGKYDLYVHNGSGGAAGWSNPVRFTIEPKHKSPIWYEAKKFGVKADGHTDDTQNLRKALKAAAKTGGVVSLQAGRVIISETIDLPAGVSIEGAGDGATSLQVLDDNPMKGGFPKQCVLQNYAADWLPVIRNYTPMIWARDNSSIKDLSLIYGNGVGFGIVVAKSSGIAENIHIERVKVIANNQPDGWHSAYSVFLAGDTYGLVIADSDFRGWGGIEVVANNHHQAYIGRNKIVNLPTGLQNSFFTRGFNESVIESNEVYYGLRNYASQSGVKYGKANIPAGSTNVPRTTLHLAMLGNIYINNLARRHNDGEMMIESGAGIWCVNVGTASPTSLSVNGQPFQADLKDAYALILAGKGIGQYRRIISNTRNTLTFEKSWDIIPDSTTCIQVGGFNVEHLWVDNTLTNNASWSGFWGNNVGHVVDGQTMRDGGPFYLWAFDNKSPATVAFIDVIGSRTIGGGGISILGKPAFGNTIRYCEVVDFRYYPNFHIQPNWLRYSNVTDKYGISITNLKDARFEGIPEATPLCDWNIIEANHVYDGPNGILIQSDAKHTILKRNRVEVDKEQVNDSGNSTVLK